MTGWPIEPSFRAEISVETHYKGVAPGGACGKAPAACELAPRQWLSFDAFRGATRHPQRFSLGLAAMARSRSRSGEVNVGGQRLWCALWGGQAQERSDLVLHRLDVQPWPGCVDGAVLPDRGMRYSAPGRRCTSLDRGVLLRAHRRERFDRLPIASPPAGRPPGAAPCLGLMDGAAAAFLHHAAIGAGKGCGKLRFLGAPIMGGRCKSLVASQLISGKRKPALAMGAA